LIEPHSGFSPLEEEPAIKSGSNGSFSQRRIAK
jgi:hypothetical protein